MSDDESNKEDEATAIVRRRIKGVTISSRKPVGKVDVDLSYTGKYKGMLPTSTSQWDLRCLDALGIYYSEKPMSLTELLDIVHENTGMFRPMTQPQTDIIKYIQESLDFSTSIGEVMVYSRRYPRETGVDLLEETQKNLGKDMFTKKSFSSETVRVSTIGQIENFIKSTVYMVFFMRNKGEPSCVPENVFVDLFNKFVLMCDLIPSTGPLWKRQAKLLQQHIKSEADVVILPSDLPKFDAVTVVSIVEVKSLAHCIEKETAEGVAYIQTRSSSSSSSSSCTDDYVKPEIYKRIGKGVLGQHGGELVVHNGIFDKSFESKRNKKAYLPGMIVVGTEVTFTLLVFSYEHMAEIFEKKVVENGKSYIYYSETKDMMKKDERDQLLEAFGRLHNTCATTV